MTSRLEWVVEGRGRDLKVKIQGPVDEEAEFASLLAELADKPQVCLDLCGVSRINSCGVREWVNFIRALTATTVVHLEGCSPPMVSQINMITNFIGVARVLSVQAPYACEGCGHEEHILVSVGSGAMPSLVAHACPKCGALMEFDDLEESYFAFLGRLGSGAS